MSDFGVSPTPRGPARAAAEASTDEAGPDLLRVRRIVVGVDGSASSQKALRQAMVIATHFQSTVEAIGAWQITAATSPYFPQRWNPERDTRDMLQEVVGAVFGSTLPVWLRASVRQGPAARVLIDASVDADLLIVGSRGHGGVLGLVLGSVSAACAEGAHCPVLVMH